MNLQALAKLDGAQPPKTHADRLMVLSQISEEAMPTFLRTLETKDPAGWMRTIMTVGALDLGDDLKAQPRSDHQKVREEWGVIATAFVELVGKGVVRKPKPEDRASAGQVDPWVSFTKDPAVIAAFNQASERLAQQANDINDAGAMTLLDGKYITTDKVTGALSLWISMACALDQPQTVKTLIDAFPNGMTAATSSASKTLKTLKFRDRQKAFGSIVEDKCFVSPFLVAMHVGSTGSMDAILAKRAEMGKTLDVPLMSLDDLEETHRYLSDAETLNQLLPAVVPKVLVQAVMPLIDSNRQALNTVIHEQMFLVEKNPDLFAAFAQAGVLHRGDETSIMNCLERGIWHAPKAIPKFLKELDWNVALPRFVSNGSPIFRSVHQIEKENEQGKREREDAVIALIKQGKALGHGDTVLQTFDSRDPTSTKTVWGPVTQLSAAGFERALVAYLDHGFDPKSVPAGGGLSLLEVAERDKHSTLGAILAHTARRRAHDLISEIENEPAAKVTP